MALANAAEKGDWVDVRRLLLAGPGLSLPLVRVSRIDILNVVLGLVEHRSEGHCQRGGNTSTAISFFVGDSPPTVIDVGTVVWCFFWPMRAGAQPPLPHPQVQTSTRKMMLACGSVPFLEIKRRCEGNGQ